MRGNVETLLSTLPGGVREDLNPGILPEGTLLASNNWLTRRGIGRPRNGYTQNFQTTDAKQVLGIGIRGTRNQTSNILIATTDHIYSWDGNTVTDVTGSGWVISAINNQVRIVTFSQSGNDYGMIINQINALREWTGSGVTTATAGSPPAGRDLCVAGNRLVVVAPTVALPYRVRWSCFKDRTSWPSINITDLTDTPGYLVACRPFGPNTFGIYKDDAVYLGSVQAAVEPFQFQFIGRVPGPLSAASLVDVLGVHYWIAEDFAIYKFDGSSPALVTSGLAKTISTNLSFSNRDQMFGFPWFSQDEREVWFFYPTISGKFNAISLNIQSNAINHHTFSSTITAALDWIMQPVVTIDSLDGFSSTIDGLDSYSSTIEGLDGSGGTNRAILMGDNGGRVSTFGQASNDNGSAIAWSFTHGWVAPGKLESRSFLDAITTYWKTAGTSTSITASVTVTDKLTDDESATTATFNPASSSQHLLTFPNKQGKLIKVALSGSDTQASLEYRGTLITSWNKGRV